MLFIGIAFLGIFAFSKLGIDLLPNVNLPHLMVQTSYPNSNPEAIEKLVTEPLESTIGTVTGVKKISSVSKEGLSIISVDFLWGTNMDLAVLSLREKLDNIRFALPQDAQRPTIIRADPSASPIVSLALTYRSQLARRGGNSEIKNQNQASSIKKQDTKIQYIDHDSPKNEISRLTELKEAARVIFRRRLEQLDGVAQAVVIGGLEREILIEVDSKKMLSLNISFNEIESALKSANTSMSAGSIMSGLFRYSLRTIGEYSNLHEIKNTVIKYQNGRTILVSDVAEVNDNFKEREGLTRLNGSETVGLLIYKEPNANTISIAQKVQETIKKLQSEYPEFNLILVSDQSGFIEDAITNVKQEILYGGILAVIVLFFFLGSVRNVFIIGITIPASLVLTILLMYLFEINFNIISLGGIAVGVGMLLDNAIIVIENVVRYKEKGLSIPKAALKGSQEVAMPIVAATLTTIVVFIPLVFVQGIAGELFKDQSYAIAFSLASSIFVAITLIPMLASRNKYFTFLTPNKEERLVISKPKKGSIIKSILFWMRFPFTFIIKSIVFVSNDIFTFLGKRLTYLLNNIYKISNGWLDKIICQYEKLLEWSLNNRRTVLILSFTLLLITAFAAIDIKKEFIPPSEHYEFIVELVYPKGTSLKGNALLTSQIEVAILSNPKVNNVVSNIGRVNEFDFLNKDQHAVNKTNLVVKLNSYKNYYDVQNELKPVLSNLGITNYSFKQIKTTYSELINPSENDIEIRIKNKDLDQAYLLTANEMLNRFENQKIEGISNVKIKQKRESQVQINN